MRTRVVVVAALLVGAAAAAATGAAPPADAAAAGRALQYANQLRWYQREGEALPRDKTCVDVPTGAPMAKQDEWALYMSPLRMVRTRGGAGKGGPQHYWIIGMLDHANGKRLRGDVAATADGGITWTCRAHTTDILRAGAADVVLTPPGANTAAAVCLLGGRKLVTLGNGGSVESVFGAPTDSVLCSADGSVWTKGAARLPSRVLGASVVTLPPRRTVSGRPLTPPRYLIVGGWRRDAGDDLWLGVPSPGYAGFDAWVALPLAVPLMTRLLALPTWGLRSRHLLVGAGELPDAVSAPSDVAKRRGLGIERDLNFTGGDQLAPPGRYSPPPEMFEAALSARTADLTAGVPLGRTYALTDMALLDVLPAVDAAVAGLAAGTLPSLRPNRTDAYQLTREGPLVNVTRLFMRLPEPRRAQLMAGSPWYPFLLQCTSAGFGGEPPPPDEPNNSTTVTPDGDEDEAGQPQFAGDVYYYSSGGKSYSTLISTHSYSGAPTAFMTREHRVRWPNTNAEAPVTATESPAVMMSLPHFDEGVDAYDNESQDSPAARAGEFPHVLGASLTGELLRGSTVMCAPNASCVRGQQFSSSCRESPWDAVCLPCTTCIKGLEHHIAVCTPTQNAQCAACVPCPPGTVIAVGCGLPGSLSYSEPLCVEAAPAGQAPLVRPPLLTHAQALGLCALLAAQAGAAIAAAVWVAVAIGRARHARKVAAAAASVAAEATGDAAGSGSVAAARAPPTKRVSEWRAGGGGGVGPLPAPPTAGAPATVAADGGRGGAALLTVALSLSTASALSVALGMAASRLDSSASAGRRGPWDETATAAVTATAFLGAVVLSVGTLVAVDRWRPRLRLRAALAQAAALGNGDVGGWARAVPLLLAVWRPQLVLLLGRTAVSGGAPSTAASAGGAATSGSSGAAVGGVRWTPAQLALLRSLTWGVLVVCDLPLLAVAMAYGIMGRDAISSSSSPGGGSGVGDGGPSFAAAVGVGLPICLFLAQLWHTVAALTAISATGQAAATARLTGKAASGDGFYDDSTDGGAGDGGSSSDSGGGGKAVVVPNPVGLQASPALTVVTAASTPASAAGAFAPSAVISPLALLAAAAPAPGSPSGTVLPVPPPSREQTYRLVGQLWSAAATPEGRRLATMRTFFSGNPHLLPAAIDAVARDPLPAEWLGLLRLLDSQMAAAAAASAAASLAPPSPRTSVDGSGGSHVGPASAPLSRQASLAGSVITGGSDAACSRAGSAPPSPRVAAVASGAPL